MRINKYLATAGYGSRRKCEEFITSGRVSINGKVMTNLAYDVLDDDVVVIGEKRVCLPQKFTYIMMHKPKGFLTTLTDDRDRKTVMNLLPNEYKNLKPIGRLDYNSEGLLLFTNDGDVAQSVMRPSKQVEKTYLVKVEGEVSLEDVKQMELGVETLAGEKFRPCKISLLERMERKTKLEIKITEGKNREIRKIFDKFGYNVYFLKRVAIGSIKLGGLSRGTIRLLKPSEIEYLKSL